MARGIPPEGARLAGFALWLTGIPGAGKSTIAAAVAEVLRQRGVRVEVLDGEEIDRVLGEDLALTREDEGRAVRRIGLVAKLLARNEVVAIVAVRAPHKAAREAARREIETGGPARVVEAYLRCGIDAAIARDPQGHYRRAIAGDGAPAVGIDDPFEPPLAPEVTVDTGGEPAAVSVALILKALEAHGLVLRPRTDEPAELEVTPTGFEPVSRP